LRELNALKGPIMHEWVWGEIHKRFFRIRMEYSSFIARFLHSTKEISFSGGSGTVIASTPGRNYRPSKTTSLHGIFGLSHSELTTNYTCSINPLSKFYFGKLDTQTIKIFKKEEPLYTTTIMVSK